MRRFNRFYTRQIGVLRERQLKSPFSLAEIRVLYELANRDGLSASTLAAELGFDPGYLSRVLARFERRGLLRRQRFAADARRRALSLTALGRRTFKPLDRASAQDIGRILGRLPEPGQTEMLSAMATITRLLGQRDAAAPPYVLRDPRPGDLGVVIARQAALYADEYGLDGTFEGLLAEIVAKFVRDFDAKRERCWIAERDGEVVGSVFVVRKSKHVAQLRMLYVDARARGLGVGSRLVEECVRFARQKSYRQIVLWTNDILVSARRIYEAAGFRLIEEERHHSFGKDLVGQNWSLDLR